MISVLALIGAASVAAADPETEFRNCTATARSDPQKALSVAGDWRVRGGGIAARLCQGLAYTGLERWSSAAGAFEQGAKEAAAIGDPRASSLWVQAGNAWLAGSEPAKAKAALDSAIAAGGLTQEMQGEAWLDRARAQVALDDLPNARADLNRGLELVPGDPFAWYLSAALALREGNRAKAATDIAKAVELAPDDAEVLVTAGTVAGQAGDMAAAKDYYERAEKAAPGSEAAKRAEAALAAETPAN